MFRIRIHNTVLHKKGYNCIAIWMCASGRYTNRQEPVIYVNGKPFSIRKEGSLEQYGGNRTQGTD